jgi:hypothetical protein
MDMIAKRAGISRQSIYDKHFSNIGEIIDKSMHLSVKNVKSECKNSSLMAIVIITTIFKFLSGNFTFI